MVTYAGSVLLRLKYLTYTCQHPTMTKHKALCNTINRRTILISRGIIATMKYKLSPKIAFALVSFFLGELGDGLNIFQVSLTNISHIMCLFLTLMHHHPYYSHIILIIYNIFPLLLCRGYI